jgi:hypothetical protein
MKTRNLLALGLIALLGAACGGTKSSAAAATTKNFSCNVPAAFMCVSVTGIPIATDMTQGNTLCTNGGGTIGTSCSTANRVGTCTYPGAPVEVDSYYFGGLVAAAAETACTTADPTSTPPTPAGTWKAG